MERLKLSLCVWGSTGSDSDSEYDWDEGDLDEGMNDEETYLFFASLAQQRSDSNFFTQVFEALNIQRALSWMRAARE